MGKFLVAIVFTIFWFTLSAQELGKLKFIVSPAGTTISSFSWDEYSLGVYKVNSNFNISSSVAAIYNFRLGNRISLSSGVALRQVKHNFSFEIHNPFEPFNIIDKINRFSHRYSINPHVGVSFYLGNIAIDLGFEPVFVLLNNTNIDFFYGPDEIIIDPSTQHSAQYMIVERNEFGRHLLTHSTPTLFIEYAISHGIGIHLTTLFRPYSKNYVYQLEIKGRTPETPTDSYFLLNDSRMNSSLLAFYLGFTYQMRKRIN